MKKVFCLVQFCLSVIFSFTQKVVVSDQDAPNFKYSCFSNSLEKLTNTNLGKVPFSAVKIIDSRADTSKIGFFYNASAAKMTRLCFKQNTTNELSGFFNSFFKSNFSESNNTLIINLRKLWVGTYDSALNGKYSKKNLSIILRIEFFLNKSDNYFPLYRFDSSVIVKTTNNEVLFDYISDLLGQSTNRIKNNYSTEKMKAISYQMLDSFNASRIKYAVSSDVLKKGIFMNFSQFRDNTPNYTDFDITFGKETDEIYVKGKNGIDSLITNAWGFCDGNHHFIRFKSNYFPLFKSGHNFDLFGPKEIKIIRPFGNTYVPVIHSSNSNYEVMANMIALGVRALLSGLQTDIKKFAPYQLDLETGQLF